jgi:hypothetical protein
LKIIFHRNPARGYAWEVYVWDDAPNGDRIQYSLKIETHKVSHRFAPFDATMVLDEAEKNKIVGALLEGLTEAGLLPKMGATEAELVATKRHLADMRSLAFQDVKPSP